MGNYFSQFHDALYPHIERKGLKNAAVYSNLFSWTIPSDWPDKDSSDPKKTYYSGSQVAHWIAGKEELPISVLHQASNNIDVAADTYSAAFYDLIYKQLKLSGQSVEMLDSDMKNFLNAFPISFFSLNNELETATNYYPAGYALVTALVYDRIIKDGNQKNSLIESGLYMAIQDALENCQEKNMAFSAPWLLDILFRPEYPLLCKALNKVKDGLGTDWAEKIHQYVRNEKHEPFSGEHQSIQEVIFLAKVIAASDHHLTAQAPAVATEKTICCALPLCRKSKTISKMWHEIKSNNVEQEKWREIVEECEVKCRYETTTLDK